MKRTSLDEGMPDPKEYPPRFRSGKVHRPARIERVVGILARSEGSTCFLIYKCAR